jgi:hypothetical protein
MGIVISENSASEVNRFVLPFSVPSESRKEPFTLDLEVATVFSLAELDREKGAGVLKRVILRRREEKIAFIAKIGYPLWLFPWSRAILIFDGLNKSSYTFSYAVFPDTKAFMDSLESSTKMRETHSAFLSDHLTYFQAPVKEKDASVTGLISDPKFLSEFDSYRREAAKIEDQPLNVALLSPIIDESAVSHNVQELEVLHSSFREDADVLRSCMATLKKVTNTFVKELRDDIRGIKDDFAAEIKKEEKIVAPKVNSLKEEYDNQLTELTKNFEKQRLPVQTEKVKLEKSKEETLARIERNKLEARSSAEKGDSASEQVWKEKINEAHKELSTIEYQLKTTDKTLKDLEERRSLEMLNLRSGLEAKVKEARKNVLELESSRDAKILIHRQEMEKLEKQTKLINDQIGRTVKSREANIAQLESLGIKSNVETTESTLVYVPFYLVCYQVGPRKRYMILPPSEVNTIGLATKLKGALGAAKIKGLLVPRFKALTLLKDTIQVVTQESAMFETEVTELGEKGSILATGSMRDEITKGLAYLRNEGWFSDNEYNAIRHTLT